MSTIDRAPQIAVGAKPKTFNEAVVDRFLSCTEENAYISQQSWARRYGVFPENSSGANIWAVEQLMNEPTYRDSIIVNLIYDNGEAYVEPK